jgi:hypothetical protein
VLFNCGVHGFSVLIAYPYYWGETVQHTVYKILRINSKSVNSVSEETNTMEWHGGCDAGSGARLPEIIEADEGTQQKSPKSRLVNLLDEVEMHVERLRRDALKLEEEKDRLLATLDSLRNSEIMIDLRDSKYATLWALLGFVSRSFLYSSQMAKVMQ